jgi:hypothetical protein
MLDDAGIQAAGVKPRGGPWPAAAVSGLALLVYVLTLAPGLSFEHNGTDGGDLVAAAWSLGVPHPSGYPTYTLLAWLFTRLPLGVVAYRANLLSAVCAAGAAGLLCASARLLIPRRGTWSADAGPASAGQGRRLWMLLSAEAGTLVAGAAAATFAFSSLLWSQAVIAEVYALLTLFAALLLWLLLRWRAGGADGLLWLAGLVFGLGLGNHLTLILGLPAFVLLLWPERRRWLRLPVLAPALFFFLAGLGVYAYLPLAARGEPPVNWGNPQTWDRFLWVVSARQYQQFAFGLDLAAVPGRLGGWAWLLGDQFGWWGLALALAGSAWWWRRDRAFALCSLAWMLLVGTYAFFYDTGDSQAYLLPVLLLLATWWAEGVLGLLRIVAGWRPDRVRQALGLALLLPLLSLGLHWQAADPDDDWQIHTYIQQTLDGVEPGGLVVVRGDAPTFALWYGLYVEEKRPDVAVVSGPLLAYIWYREQVREQAPHLVLNEPGAGEVTIDDLVRDLIASNLPARPVYATDPSDAWKEAFDFERVEGSSVYRASPRTSP